jgi:hypothetical protein
LWFVIAGRQTAERGLAVPVELRNVPRDIELTQEAVRTVEVRLRASPGLIDTLDPDKVLAIVDLAGAHEGEKIVQLTPDRIQVPFGFRVVKITPSLLTLRLESTRQKSVPVRPRVVGRPVTGYEMADVVSEPAQVRVSGPRSSVQRAENAFTEPISIDAADHTVQELVNVGLDDPQLRLDGASQVKVTVRLREVRGTRVFGNLPVIARGGPAQIEPSRVAVVLSGPPAVLASFEPASLRPYVELPDGAQEATRLRPAVDLAEGAGLAVLEMRPAQVLVRPLRRSPPR